MFSRLSCRNKLLLWLIPVLVVGLLSLSFAAYWYINNVIKIELNTSMLAMTSKTAEGINNWCKTIILEPETIAATPAAKAINTDFSIVDEQNKNRSKILHKKYPDIFLDIYAANRDGVYHTILENGDSSSVFAGNINSREYFKSIMSGGSAQISLPAVSHTTGIPTLFAVAPITDDDGKPAGLIGAGISLEYVQRIAEGLKVGETGYGVVLAQDGTFIYHPKKEFVLGKKISELPDLGAVELGNRMMAGGSGIYHYIFEGQKKVAFYQPVPFTGWSVATTITEAELLAPVTRMIQLLAAITLALMLVVVMGIWMTAQRVSQPLQELVAHAREITAGNFTLPKLMVKNQDEFGTLTETFNIMIETIRKMIEELGDKNKILQAEVYERSRAEEALQQAHDQLEQKVEEKTKELTSVNEEIQTINDTLVDTNKRLQEEIAVKQQIEADLLIRERQYRATTSLLTRPIDEVEYCLELILQNALQLIKAPDGFIGLYDEDGNTVLIHHGIGIHASREMESIQGNLGIQGHVYKTGEILYVPDYKKYSQRIYDQRLERLSSIIALPLKQGGQVKGVLAASWVDQVHHVSEEDIAVLRQFSDLASVALERSNIHEQNCYMAFHDSLTDLPNRVSLNTRLEEELKMARNDEAAGVILFIDVDDFKSVNDNFGHSSGDQVIIAASKHISKAVGKKAFLARLGGDEFVAVVPGETSRAIAAEIAQKTVVALNQEYEVSDQKLHLSASIGVVIYPEDGDTAEDLLKKADIAMYTAKKADKNCWRFYEPVLLQEAYEKVMLTNSLRHALVRSEMFLQYQPQLTSDGRTVTGFEALLRWNSSQYGLVSPLRFIPLAEQSGLILSIGKWVLQEACQFARRLSDMGRSDLHVAVNISPKQLLAEDFVASVCDSITNAGIKPEQIVVEVTESVLIESLKESIGKLNQLRKFGISLALDDFGTGYSSLTYLKSLPVNILKIDKSFLEKSSSDELQWHVVGSIIDLGHVLGLTIVAEGVEIEAQLELLRKYGCDCIQGYIFSRPICEEDAIQFLSRSHIKEAENAVL